MKVLRARRTDRFVYFLVRCRCGRQFGHRAQRRLIVCYQCGRIAEAARPRRGAFGGRCQGALSGASLASGRAATAATASDLLSGVGRA